MYYTYHMDTKAKIPRASKLLTIDLGADLKASWLHWCADHQLVPSKALKRLIESTLSQALQASQAPPHPIPIVHIGTSSDTRSNVVYKSYTPPFATQERITRASSQPKVVVKVSFTLSEHEALVAFATAQGFGVQEFVIAAVRAALAQAPTYGQAELEALTRSNATLVNVVLALVALKSETDDATIAERLASLEHEVKSHIEHVSRSMAIGTRRWQLNV